MFKTLKSLILSSLFISSIYADELLIVQAVSTTGKSFAVRKGSGDGVSKGQESLFSSKKASFAAKAKVVSRDYSVWEVSGKKGAVPFSKGDFINFSNSLENIAIEIPRISLKPKDELAFRAENKWVIKGHYSLALSETISSTDSSQNTGRVGLQLSGLYAWRTSIHWEFAAGVRFDRENSTLERPQLDIPTSRSLLTGEIVYHFGPSRGSRNNIYIGIGAAFGLSNTEVNGSVSTGSALILPSLKLGYLNYISPSYSLVFEGTIESIAASEAFVDTDEQTTNIVNAKFGIGVRF